MSLTWIRWPNLLWSATPSVMARPFRENGGDAITVALGICKALWRALKIEGLCTTVVALMYSGTWNSKRVYWVQIFSYVAWILIVMASRHRPNDLEEVNTLRCQGMVIQYWGSKFVHGLSKQRLNVGQGKWNGKAMNLRKQVTAALGRHFNFLVGPYSPSIVSELLCRLGCRFNWECLYI